MRRMILLSIFILTFILISCGGDSTNPTTGGSGSGSGSGDVIGNFTIPEGGLSVAEQAEPLDPNNTKKTIFRKGDHGSQFFRIPAIITTSKGTILAGTDRRYDKTADVGKSSKVDVIVRRSEDLGNTWGPAITIGPGATQSNGSDAYGDPFFVNTHSGDIICGIVKNPGFQRPAETVLYKSTDDGKTWTEIYDFHSTDADLFEGATSGSKGFAASGRGITITKGALAQGAKRSLIFGYFWTGTGNKSYNVAAMLSEDDGTTWRNLGSLNRVESDIDETKIIDLADGTLMMNHRRPAGKGGRSWSKWNGSSWDYQGIDPEITDPGNNADLVRYELPKYASGERVVYTPIKGNKTVLMIQSDSEANSGGNAWYGSRFNHTVHMTKNDFNDGNGTQNGKYAYEKQLVRGGEELLSGYPAMTVLPDGTIGVLVEEDPDGDPYEEDNSLWDRYDIVFRRFNLNWLTGGAEKITYEEAAFQNQ